MNSSNRSCDLAMKDFNCVLVDVANGSLLLRETAWMGGLCLLRGEGAVRANIPLRAVRRSDFVARQLLASRSVRPSASRLQASRDLKLSYFLYLYRVNANRS